MGALADILAITGPIFLIIALGYAATRSGAFPKDGVRLFGRFVLYFAMPAMLFQALSKRAIAEIAAPGFLLAYGAGSLAILLTMLAIMRGLRRAPLTGAAVAALGVSCSNSGFIGYPLLTQLFGGQAATPLAQAMIVENILVIPLVLALAETGRNHGAGALRAGAAALRRVATNPLILAILAGGLASLLALPVPALFDRTFDLLARASTAVALFTIGSALVGLRLGGMAGDAMMVAALKLVGHPLAVATAFAAFGYGAREVLVPVIIASVPMIAIYPLIGGQYGEEGPCAARVLATVTASFATISALLYAARAGGLLP